MMHAYYSPNKCKVHAENQKSPNTFLNNMMTVESSSIFARLTANI